MPMFSIVKNNKALSLLARWARKGQISPANKRAEDPLANKERQGGWAAAFARKGQILLEALFFIVFILLFLSAVRFFQTVAQKTIQKERLSAVKKLSKKQAKPSWVRPL